MRIASASSLPGSVSTMTRRMPVNRGFSTSTPVGGMIAEPGAPARVTSRTDCSAAATPRRAIAVAPSSAPCTICRREIPLIRWPFRC
jgi:hypothetical protein